MEKSRSSRFTLFVFFFFVIVLVGTAIWNGAAAQPTNAALAALESDSQVKVLPTADLIHFSPSDNQSKSGLIVYPGGNVDFRAYAPVLSKIAAQGFHVFIPSMPLNLSVLDSSAADGIIAANPEIEQWFIAGHSLGGVSAASYAASRSAIDGVILWAAYPADDGLKNTSVPVLSIYGTLDGLSTPVEVEASRTLLPADTIFLAVEGGNHAQFGDYGTQEGDNRAAISIDAQHNLVAEATAAFMAQIIK